MGETSVQMGRKLSFNKRPFAKAVSRRTSQMSGISNYPPQEIDPVQCDEDFVKIHQRYRGVSFCGNDIDYDERIRVPRMSLTSLFHANTSKTSRDSSNSGLNSLKEEEATETVNTGYDYKPASYDLTRGLRNIDSTTPTPPSQLANFNMNTSLKKIKSNISDGISPSRIPKLPPKQINEPFKCDYIPTVLRPTDTNDNVYSPMKAAITTTINNNSATIQRTATVSHLRWDNEPIRSHWKMDMESDDCSGCDTKFTLFLRKHHCRHCGDIFCFECLKYMANLNVLAKFEKPRPTSTEDSMCKVSKVCRRCYDEYLEFLKGEGQFEGYTKQQESSNGVVSSSIPSDWAWSSF